ncbi:MAG TPA: TFIIB-type zinc ribbon-containing protein [Halococcus sp.]|nr:TFIIB-type zinc ribbon-containing protein [Halococcus sp.]
MRIRGERECKDCGTRWSYYETGSVNCPNCGSLRSVGTDERTQHTASAARLDLSEARNRLDVGGDGADIRATAELAVEVCREFIRQSGFIDAGDLRNLDETYLAALELRYVAEELVRAMRVSDEEERYFLSLLAGADRGERPTPEEVPESLQAARGLASAKAIEEYRRDVGTYLDDHPDSEVRAAFGTLTEHTKRVQALDGDVAPELADRLVRIARGLSSYLREGDENALVTARDRLSRLG